MEDDHQMWLSHSGAATHELPQNHPFLGGSFGTPNFVDPISLVQQMARGSACLESGHVCLQVWVCFDLG